MTTLTSAPSIANIRPRSRHLLPVVSLALLALVVGVVATWNGISYSHDGSYYLAFARAIQQDGLLRLNLTPWSTLQTSNFLDQWPPIYPLILAVGGVLRLDPIPWARVVSISTLVAAALLTYGMGWTILRSRSGAWTAGALFVAVPSTTNAVFGLAHSETVFTVMVLAMTWLLLGYRFGDDTKTNRPALWAALIAGFMMLTRYIAVGAVFGGLIYLFLWARTVRRPRRWLPVFYFSLSVAPLAAWSFYLRAKTGSFSGWQPSNDPLTFEHIPESLRQMMVEQLHGFVLPLRSIGLMSNWWALALAGLFALLVAVLLWRQRALVRGAFDSRHLLLVLVVGLYLSGYWVLAARSGTVIADWRHYVPIYPLLLILIVQLVLLARVPRWLTTLVLTCFLVSGAQSAVRTGEGLLWNSPAWRYSTLLNRLPEIVRTDDTLIHSDVPTYLLLRLGLRSVNRVFGGDAGFRDYTCDQLTYPEGFPYAVFVVIDTPFLRETPPEEAAAFYRQWAEPCGTVESIVNDSFVAVTTVRLTGR